MFKDGGRCCLQMPIQIAQRDLHHCLQMVLQVFLLKAFKFLFRGAPYFSCNCIRKIMLQENSKNVHVCHALFPCLFKILWKASFPIVHTKSFSCPFLLIFP